MGRVSPSDQNQSGKNKPSKPYVPAPPTQRQNSNPFAPGFEPFYIPPTAPIRNVIGEIPKAEINAQPQNANPFGARFQPFHIPETAPIRKVTGQSKPPRSSALPSLGRGDDIPAALYPDGVSTGVGGGNAGQAQSTNPNGSGYIPPTPRNTSGVDSGGGDTRVNAAGVVQKGRNFDSMASGLFNDIASRYENDGFSSPETVALIKGMGEGTSFSSNRLPATADSLYTDTEGAVDAFEKPDLAINTGAKQNTDVNVGFETPNSVQFEAPNAELTNITTEAGVKRPVEYTNHMRNTNIDGLDALRMNEKQHGLIYASGQYWAKGADGNAVKVDRDLAKGVKRGAEGAASQLAAYLKNGGSKPEDGGFELANTDIPTSVADKPSQQEFAPSDQVEFTKPDEDQETFGTQSKVNTNLFR